MNYSRDVRIQMIPIDHITVLNPRARGKSKFNQIVDNIAKLGLKRPVTVAPDGGQNGSTRYLLICGQGRLEGYIQLGQTEIPAIVIDRPKEDLLLMSLAENLARRQHSAASLLQEVGNLKERGYSFDEIAKKTDLHPSYVRGIVHLLKKGEDRLIQAVEKKQIPLGIAITIASADDKAVQRALTEAYEKDELRGRALIRARRLIESRRTRGKSVRRNKRLQSDEISSSNVLRAYQQETARQSMAVQKARLCETRLMFIVGALKRILNDENFATLLRAETIDTLPQYIADRIGGEES